MHIKLPKEHKEQIKDSLKDFFYYERSEEIGDLAAENMLDLILKEIGPHFYNIGVRDAKVIVEQNMINIEEDVSSLERPIVRKRS